MKNEFEGFYKVSLESEYLLGSVSRTKNSRSNEYEHYRKIGLSKFSKKNEQTNLRMRDRRVTRYTCSERRKLPMTERKAASKRTQQRMKTQIE